MTKFSIKSLKSEIDKAGNPVGQFEINKLKPGQGITIGNALRRVLLGDLAGTAITGIQILNTTDEFSTLEGVREDILELILNFKKVIIKNNSSNTTKELKIGKLKVQGPAIITASSIQTPLGLEIMNPNHYIGTISNSNTLEMEIIFEDGFGYKLAENSNKDNSIGTLQIDAIFMPILKVNYQVEQVYGDSTESLLITIVTNKSLTPKSALSKALQFLIQFFIELLESQIKNEIDNSDKINFKFLKEIRTDISVEELQLSVRSYNCLKRAQINTISDLLQYSPKKLQEIKNFGLKSTNEIFEALKNKLGIILTDLP